MAAAADDGIEYSKSMRPTDDEFDAKVMYVYDQLVQCKRLSEIKKGFRGKFDRGKKRKTSDRTIRNYVSRARIVLSHHADVTRDGEKAVSIAYWRSVIADPKQSAAEKRQARIRIEKILGIEAAIKVAPTNTKGEDLTFDQAMGMMEKIAASIPQDDETEE